MENDFNKKIKGALLILFLGFVGIWITLAVNDAHNAPANGTSSSGTTTPVSLQPTPYQEKNLMNSKVIIDNFSNSAPNLHPTATDTNEIIVTGQLASGYLYIIASANGKALQTSDPGNYDDVYANLIQLTYQGTPASREYGGHLVESASLETPQNSNYTELLYPLTNVGYISSYQDTHGKLISSSNILWSNWLTILNDTSHNDNLEVYSSTEKEGTIEKLIIYYTCAQGSDCSITTVPVSS